MSGVRAALPAALILAVLTAAGCGAATESDGAPATTAPAKLGPAPTVRIGLLGDDVAGPSLARAVAQGARLAVSQHTSGDSAGGLDVVIVSRDTDGTEAGARAAAASLVAAHVVAVIGPQTTTEVLGAEPVLAAAGIPTLTVTATSPTLAGRWDQLLDVVPDDASVATAVGSLVAGTLEERRVVVVRDPEASAAAAAATAAVQAAGATATSLTVRDVTGASQVATTIEDGGADGVVVAARPSLASALVSALAAAGFTGSSVVLAGTASPGVVLGAAGEAADGVRIASAADQTEGAAEDVTSQALLLRDAYRAAYGRIPPTWAAEAYDAAGFVLAGLTAGATSAAALLAYLTTHQWVGVTGTLGFTGGQPTDPRVYVSIVRDGTAVQVGTLG